MESIFITALKAAGLTPACIIAIVCIAVLCYVIRRLFDTIEKQSSAMTTIGSGIGEIKTLISTVLTMGGGR